MNFHSPARRRLLAADQVATSKDLGNVMLTADFATLAANPALFAKLPYDAERDFAPIGVASPARLKAMASHVKAERERWGTLIRAKRIQLD